MDLPYTLEQQETRMRVVRDGELHQLYREAELCQIKCKCSDSYDQYNVNARIAWLKPAATDDPELVDGFRERVWQWDFDLHQLRQRERPRTETAWWKAGLVESAGGLELDEDEPRYQYCRSTSSPLTQLLC
jgi:hypothetical protein